MIRKEGIAYFYHFVADPHDLLYQEVPDGAKAKNWYLTESIRGDLFLSHKKGPGNFVAYSDVEKRAELVHRQKDYPMKTICKEAHVQYQIYGGAPSQQFLTLSDADLDDILRKIMLRKCFRQMY